MLKGKTNKIIHKKKNNKSKAKYLFYTGTSWLRVGVYVCKFSENNLIKIIFTS